MSDKAVGRGGLERVGAAIAGWFVRPVGAGAADAPVARLSVRAPVDEPVVLAGGSGAAFGLGAALALAAASSGAAVLACWRVPAATRRRGGVSIGRTRRLVASLQARGVEATAAGRLVVVALPEDARDAVMLLRRVESASGGAVCVPLLGGARGEEWDAVLVERGLAVLHGADAGLLELAGARLEEQGVETRVVATAPGPLARWLALSGWAPPGGRALRRAVGLA